MRVILILCLVAGALAAPKQQKEKTDVKEAVKKPVGVPISIEVVPTVTLKKDVDEDISAYADIFLKDVNQKTINRVVATPVATHVAVPFAAPAATKPVPTTAVTIMNEQYKKNLVDLLFKKDNQLRIGFDSLPAAERGSIKDLIPKPPVEVLVVGAILKVAVLAFLVTQAGGVTGAIQTGTSILEGIQNVVATNPEIMQTLSSILPSLVPILFPSDAASMDADVMLNGTTATAITRLGGISGDIYLAQLAPKPTATSPITIISGAIEGLNPGTHTLRIHRSGDVSNNCAMVGPEYSDLNLRVFEVADDGRVVLFLQEVDVPLLGKGNIMGRSLVIKSLDGKDTYCGIVVNP